TICHKDTTSIWANIISPGNGGPYTYTWTNGVTTLSTNVVGFYPSQPNTYTVIISDGCSIPNAVAISTVYVHPLPNGYFTSDFVQGCPPLKVWFRGISDSAIVYQWEFGNGETGSGQSITSEYTAVGTYSVKMTMINQYGCVKDTAAANYITVHPNPTADFVLDKYETTIFDPTFYATNLSIGANQYEWDFGAPDQPNNTTTFANPIHTYVYAGEYNVTLVAINEYGCADRSTQKVIIHPDYLLYIPNAFTPDGNGINDVFQPKALGVLETPYKMEIYDRWGELVFESENFNEGWNGQIKGKMQMAKNDVYVYRIIVTDMKNNKHIYTGHVTLLGSSNK
ncbi:MAG: PKD domain-containing protein, partial [Bacteroidetes bacterium]